MQIIPILTAVIIAKLFHAIAEKGIGYQIWRYVPYLCKMWLTEQYIVYCTIIAGETKSMHHINITT